MKTEKKFDISQFSPCLGALEYYDTKKSFQEAWQYCHRGDWMLWISNQIDVDRRKLFLAKALCAKTVIHLMKDERSRKAVEVAEQYGLGEANETELNAAASAAYAAADAAASAAYAAAYAASAAAYAASAAASAAAAAADSAAYAAASAAASAAAYAAFVAASAAAMEKNQKITADICREILTIEVFSKVRES